MPRKSRPPKKQIVKEAEPESPSMLSVLSKTNSCNSSGGSHLVESSLLILDAYEHRLCHGQMVPSSALTDLRRELDQQPSFAGSLDVTLRLLALQEKAQQHEKKEQQQEAHGGTRTTAAATGRSATRNSSSREQQADQDDLTSLRPPTPGPFKKSDPSIPMSPHSSSSSYQYSTSPSTRRGRHVYSPSSPWSNDSAEERIRRPQRQWLVNEDVVEEDEEEEVDEAELARRRSQVRVRRLNSPNSSHHRRQQLGVVQQEESSPVANHYRTTSPNRRTPTSWQPQQQVHFKDQARSVVVPTNVREVEHTRTNTTTTTVRPIPRPRTDTAARRSGRAAITPGSPILQGAPNPDYIVQFKDQAQSLLVVTAVQAGDNDDHDHHGHYEHIPVAIAVPVFEEEEIQGESHHQPRKTPSQQQRHRHRRRRVYQQVMI
jgi:hypothetical protein